MPEWIWSIVIGGMVMGLIGVIYRGVLTKNEHGELCKGAKKEVFDDFKITLKEEIQGMKDYFDIKIENVVLKEIRKINGGGSK